MQKFLLLTSLLFFIFFKANSQTIEFSNQAHSPVTITLQKQNKTIFFQYAEEKKFINIYELATFARDGIFPAKLIPIRENLYIDEIIAIFNYRNKNGTYLVILDRGKEDNVVKGYNYSLYFLDYFILDGKLEVAERRLSNISDLLVNCYDGIKSETQEKVICPFTTVKSAIAYLTLENLP